MCFCVCACLSDRSVPAMTLIVGVPSDTAQKSLDESPRLATFTVDSAVPVEPSIDVSGLLAEPVMSVPLTPASSSDPLKSLSPASIPVAHQAGASSPLMISLTNASPSPRTSLLGPLPMPSEFGVPVFHPSRRAAPSSAPASKSRTPIPVEVSNRRLASELKP